jgi:hypothetical protein
MRLKSSACVCVCVCVCVLLYGELNQTIACLIEDDDIDTVVEVATVKAQSDTYARVHATVLQQKSSTMYVSMHVCMYASMQIGFSAHVRMCACQGHEC